MDYIDYLVLEHIKRDFLNEYYEELKRSQNTIENYKIQRRYLDKLPELYKQGLSITEVYELQERLDSVRDFVDYVVKNY